MCKINMVVIYVKEIALEMSNKSKTKVFSNVWKTIAVQITYFAIGILSSRGAILGDYSPFGTAFIAATPYNCLISSMAGCIVGYVLPSSINMSMRYVATVIAVSAIRWTLNDIKKITLNSMFAPTITFLASIATGLAIASVDDFKLSIILTVIFEAFLSAAGSYFFSKTVKIANTKNGIIGFCQEEFVCFCMTICIITLSFSRLYIYGMSVGRIMAVLIILFCSRYAGVAGGSVSGIAAGIIFSISSSSLSYISGAYAFAGMMAGLFSPLGRVATITAMIVSNTIMSLETGDISSIISSSCEVSIASTIFMLIPKNVLNRFTNLFLKQENVAKVDSLRKSIAMRLDYVSKAMGEVSESVTSVAKKLDVIDIQNTDKICSNAANYTCRECGLKVFCWDKEADFTKSIFLKINNKLKNTGKIKESDFSELFSHRCSKYPELIRAINRYYDEFTIKESAQRRMGEIRGVVSEQFMGMSRILKEIGEEFKNYEKFNDSISQKLNLQLKQMDITPLYISCREDKFNRLSIEIEIMNHERRNLDKIEIKKVISKICHKSMDEPLVTYADDRCRIQISEKPGLELSIGTAQHICNNGKLCGDSFHYFDDGMGRKIIIISDGMGTGGRAAVDGAMTTNIMGKLIKSGLGFNSALKVANSALLIKSGEESLSTIDITCVDMFTGKAEFLKAGASLTFIKKGNRVIKVNTPSLPVGILPDIEFSSTSAVLDDNDWILMISDGAISNGSSWIESELKSYTGDCPEDFAKHIVNLAAKKSYDGHDDDITAIAIRICTK